MLHPIPYSCGMSDLTSNGASTDPWMQVLNSGVFHIVAILSSEEIPPDLILVRFAPGRNRVNQ